ncbi:MAG: hypothetical protein ACOYJX_09785 [Acutalibacteraceae bacterium]|jgi:hypothetical protein
MENILVVLILLALVGGIVLYLILRNKKRNEPCIGCPYAKQCGGGGQSSGFACGSESKE